MIHLIIDNRFDEIADNCALSQGIRACLCASHRRAWVLLQSDGEFAKVETRYHGLALKPGKNGVNTSGGGSDNGLAAYLNWHGRPYCSLLHGYARTKVEASIEIDVEIPC